MPKKTITRHFSLYQPPDPGHQVPAVYHAYFIAASDWAAPRSGIATIIPLTDNSPVPEDVHLLVKVGGAAAAMEQAERLVTDLVGNLGLKRLPPL